MNKRKHIGAGGKYRFGFNSKENDGETVATGEGTQDYGMRIYNPAIGKFLSVDPISAKFAYYTPYQFAGNKPINSIDIDGLEDAISITNAETQETKFFTSEEESFSEIKENLCAAVGINSEDLPPHGVLIFYYDGRGEQPSVQAQFNPAYAEVIEDTRSVGQQLYDWGRELDRRYEGTKGLRNLGQDLSKTGNLIKTGAIIITVINPLVGIELYNIGAAIDDAGTIIQAGVDVEEGNYKDAVIRTVSVGAGRLTGALSESIPGDEVRRIATNAYIDKAIDKIKENSLENGKPKEVAAPNQGKLTTPIIVPIEKNIE